jgi:hypothetical protein
MGTENQEEVADLAMTMNPTSKKEEMKDVFAVIYRIETKGLTDDKLEYEIEQLEQRLREDTGDKSWKLKDKTSDGTKLTVAFEREILGSVQRS